jgi:hypothetical protein
MRTALVALLLLLPACEKLRQAQRSIDGLVTLQKAVQQATGHENVTVVLNNGRYLSIGLVNSPWKSLPPAAKAAKARQVAGLAVAAYPDRGSLARINITYTTNRTYLLIFHYTNATDSTLESSAPGRCYCESKQHSQDRPVAYRDGCLRRQCRSEHGRGLPLPPEERIGPAGFRAVELEALG